ATAGARAGRGRAGAVRARGLLGPRSRRHGRGLAGLAREQIGRPAGLAAAIAILYIVIIALAGLGIVVVKALGGEQVPMKAGTVLTFPDRSDITREYVAGRSSIVKIPPGSTYHFGPDAGQSMVFHEGFNLAIPPGAPFKSDPTAKGFELPPETRRLVPGSSWGTFTIACTIPIALFVGWYMYRLRKGKILEAS